MKHFYILIYFIIIICNISASEIKDLGGEIRVPLPENWQVLSEDDTFPFQLINQELSAEVLMYKSNISNSETIKSEKALKGSVDIIIQDIIMTLPEAKLLSSTGKIDDNRAIFSLEFISVDTITNEQMFHRLNGYLYNLPNEKQILFTLWGKANSSSQEILQHEILLIQNNFSYYGESKISFFEATQSIDWKLSIVVLFVFVIVLMFFKKYKSTESIQYSEDSHFWRCTCGRQNHNNNDKCNRCGQTRQTNETV